MNGPWTRPTTVGISLWTSVQSVLSYGVLEVDIWISSSTYGVLCRGSTYYQVIN